MPFPFSLRKGGDVYLLHNEDCESDDEHGLNLLNTLFTATGAEHPLKNSTYIRRLFYQS